MRLRYLLLAGAFGLAGAAGAEVYDDFGGAAIDAGRWARSGETAFFTQSGGRLHFPCENGASERLVSTESFQAGFFQLEFRDYDSTNVSPANRGLGSYVAIGLAAGAERVRTIRGDVAPHGYFEANYFGKGTFELWYHRADATSGRLGIYFDGAKVSFFYSAGLDPEKGWRRVGPSVTPHWSSLPKLYIAGHAGGSGCTRFAIDKVEYTPAPLPPSLSKALELP